MTIPMMSSPKEGRDPLCIYNPYTACYFIIIELQNRQITSLYNLSPNNFFFFFSPSCFSFLSFEPDVEVNDRLLIPLVSEEREFCFGCNCGWVSGVCAREGGPTGGRQCRKLRISWYDTGWPGWRFIRPGPWG